MQEPGWLGRGFLSVPGLEEFLGMCRGREVARRRRRRRRTGSGKSTINRGMFDTTRWRVKVLQILGEGDGKKSGDGVLFNCRGFEGGVSLPEIWGENQIFSKVTQDLWDLQRGRRRDLVTGKFLSK